MPKMQIVICHALLHQLGHSTCGLLTFLLIGIFTKSPDNMLSFDLININKCLLCITIRQSLNKANTINPNFLYHDVV